MITIQDAERIVANIKYRLDEMAKPEIWYKYTKNMECGELREFKQSFIDDEIIMEALQKQIPMEVNVKKRSRFRGACYYDYYCRVCGKQQKLPGAKQIRDGCFCERCGQKLKWGEN